MHGYLWQSLRLLAYDTNSLSGRRKEEVAEQVRALVCIACAKRFPRRWQLCDFAV